MATAEECTVSDEKLNDTEEKADILLRRNSQAIRENRHFISEAFEFLNDVESDQEQGYSNTCVSSKGSKAQQKQKEVTRQNMSICEEDEQVYSNVEHSGKTQAVRDEPNYENVTNGMLGLESVAQDFLNVSRDCDSQSTERCNTKDSGFASLERRPLYDAGGSAESNLPLANVSRTSDSDDNDEDEQESATACDSNYENIQSSDRDDSYNANSSVAAGSVGMSIPGRNYSNSENVYDDLNLSVTSCQPENSNADTPCFDSGDDDAIVLAAQNFVTENNGQIRKDPGQGCSNSGVLSEQLGHQASVADNVPEYENLKRPESKSINFAYIVPDNSAVSSDPGKSNVRPQNKDAYDKVICIDFSKTAPSKSTQVPEETRASALESSGKDGDTFDELTEYLTPTLRADSESNLEKQSRMARANSVDDEDDDVDDYNVQSSIAVVDAEQDYDTISLQDFSNGAAHLSTVSAGENGAKPSHRVTDSGNAEVFKAFSLSPGSGDISDRLSENMSSNMATESETVGGENRASHNSALQEREDGKLFQQSSVAKDMDSDSVDEVPTRRPKLERNLSAEIGSDDSSDEDIGIYAESYRRSNWIRVSAEGKIEISMVKKPSTPQISSSSSSSGAGSLSSSTSSSSTSKSLIPVANGLPDSGCGSTKSENLEDIKEESLPVSPKDDVFSDPLSDMVIRPKLMHKRSDSTTTTASEVEFKRQYVSRRRCLIQRADSQQEYHRLSARVYDQDKQVVVHRSTNDDDLGLHLLDSHPAFITSVDPGSPADLAGIVEGQILVSVNEHTVLTTDHCDIVKLIQSCEGNVRLGVASSDFQPVRDLQAPVMSGFMYKLGNSSFVRTWKKRYFILRQDNCLYYYKNDQDNHDPLGAVPLGGYTISRHTDTSKDFCFKAEKYGARTYYFMTDNRDQLTEWVGALTEAAARSKKRKESFLSVSSHNVGLPALDIRRPECSGNLGKLSPSHRSWRRRYCVLKDACVYYYKDVNSLRALGVAHLHGYKVDAENHPRRKHSFSLQPPESKMRNFHFSADNETDKKRWVESLIHSIQRWVQVEREEDC